MTVSKARFQCKDFFLMGGRGPYFWGGFLFFFVGIFLGGASEGWAIEQSSISDQVGAVDRSLKALAHPAMWAVVVYTGVVSLIKQNLVGIGIAAVGAVALTQLSGWIQTQFALTL